MVRDEEASDGESDEAEPPKKKRKGREKKKKGKVRAGASRIPGCDRTSQQCRYLCMARLTAISAISSPRCCFHKRPVAIDSRRLNRR
mgnify:CR=1 FL=1